MNKITIKVTGMMCGGCEKRVENALKQIEGITEVTANHSSGEVTIKTEGEVNKEQIKEAIEDIGYEVQE